VTPETPGRQRTARGSELQQVSPSGGTAVVIPWIRSGRARPAQPTKEPAMKVYAKVAKSTGYYVDGKDHYRLQYKRETELRQWPSVLMVDFSSRSEAKAYAATNGYVLVAKWSDAS
jgi:hypothetical protein